MTAPELELGLEAGGGMQAALEKQVAHLTAEMGNLQNKIMVLEAKQHELRVIEGRKQA